MSESRGRYELGHMNLSAEEAASRLEKRLKRDRRGNHAPEYGITISAGMSEEICGVLAALATTAARARREALEEAAKVAEEKAAFLDAQDFMFRAKGARIAAQAIRALVANTPEPTP